MAALTHSYKKTVQFYSTVMYYVLVKPVHTGDKVDCCRNRRQISNKVDCCRYGRLCCRCGRLCCRYGRLCCQFWRQIGNNVNLTACGGRHCRQLRRLCCQYSQLCWRYGRLGRQCVRGQSDAVDKATDSTVLNSTLLPMCTGPNSRGVRILCQKNLKFCAPFLGILCKFCATFQPLFSMVNLSVSAAPTNSQTLTT